jgi:Flp pilus assembly protein protease CpaA
MADREPLVHPLALHVAQIASKGHVAALYFSLAVALVAGSAAVFFFAVERTSIAIRDLRWPRRTAQPAAQFVVDPAMIRSADQVPRPSR